MKSLARHRFDNIMMCYSLCFNNVCKIWLCRTNYGFKSSATMRLRTLLGIKINLSKNYIHCLKVVFYMSTTIAVSQIILKNPALKRLSRLKITSYRSHTNYPFLYLIDRPLLRHTVFIGHNFIITTN